MASANVLLFDALSRVIHPIYRKTVIEIWCQYAQKLWYTLSVILRRSVMKIKACARCWPECRPGTRWNPIRSVLILSLYFLPSGDSKGMASIQWAVTAMYGVRLGSDQRSIVNEIFPIDLFCIQAISCQVVVNQSTCVSTALTFISCRNVSKSSSSRSCTRLRMVVRWGMSVSLSSLRSIKNIARKRGLSITLMLWENIQNKFNQ